MTSVCILGAWHRVDDTRLFTKFGRSLAAAGYDTSVVGHASSDDVTTRDGVTLVGVSGWDEKPGGFMLPMVIKVVLNCYRAAWRIRADIYQVCDPLSIPFGIFAALIGKRVIYDVHEYYPEQILYKDDMDIMTRLMYGMLIFVLDPLLCRLARAVVVVDENMTRYDKYGATTIHNFQPRDMFVPAGDKVPHNPVRLITDGGFGDHRATYELIQAVGIASRSVPVRLDIHGVFFRKDYEDKCRQLIEDEHLGDIVEIHEWIPHAEMPVPTAAADIGILPFQPLRWLMGVRYPNKFSQYCGCGLPIICADLPRLAGLAAEIPCGIRADCSDPADLADAIVMMASDPKMRQVFGCAGRAAVDDWMNWETEETKLFEVYRRVTG